MKILIIGTNSESIVGFRKDFIKKLILENNEVYVICSDDRKIEKIQEMGVVKVFVTQMKNTSANIFSLSKYKKQLKSCIYEIKPDTVFSFMLKPAIYGSIAAKKCGVKKIYAMIEGLGRVFTFNTFFNKILRVYIGFQFKKAFKSLSKLFLLNQDDREFFVSKKFVEENKIFLLNGIGVDLEEFNFSEISADNMFLMIARLLKEKGVYEYCEAAQIVKKKYPDVRFCLLGGEDTITKADLQKYSAVEYLGVTDNVSGVIDKSSAFVLPTFYKEGLPRSIMEAMAKGRPVITTDTNGCKDMVDNGINGFIVPKQNINALAQAMEALAEDKHLQRSMGQNSRKMAEEKYNAVTINETLFSQII